MMLSFSIPEMRPMIVAGLAARRGDGYAVRMRQKRQTIRHRGPVWQRMIAEAEGGAGNGGRVERDLHLWWKSRSSERELLGVVRGFEIYPVTIARFPADPFSEVVVNIGGDGAVPAFSAAVDPAHRLTARDAGVFGFAYHDGFDEWLDFVRFFVPKPGDRFIGALIRW